MKILFFFIFFLFSTWVCADEVAEEHLQKMFKKEIPLDSEYLDVGSKKNQESFLLENLSFITASSSFTPSGLFLGDGVDTVLGEGKGNCLSFNTRSMTSELESTAVQVDFQLRKVEDSFELARIIGANIRGAVTGGFGEVSGKIGWVNEKNLNSYSVYLLASVRVRNAEQIIVDERINDERLKLFDADQGESLFKKACGDSYVRGMITGGEFLALFEMRSKSEREKKVINAQIEAKGLAGSWSASAEFSNALEQAAKITSISVSTHYEGPSANIPVTTEGIINFATSFPVFLQTRGTAWNYTATTKAYETLPNYPVGRAIEIKNQKDVLDHLAKAGLMARAVMANLTHIQTNIGEYETSADYQEVLSSIEKDLLVYIEKIYFAARACAAASDCKRLAVSPLFELARRLPKRQAIEMVEGRCKVENDKARFINLSGGCRDVSTGYVWSMVAPSTMNYMDAATYCTNLKQNGIGGWMLPSSTELVTLVGPQGAQDGLVGDFTGWYWSSDLQRVTVSNGSTRPSDERLTLGVLCRLAVL